MNYYSSRQNLEQWWAKQFFKIYVIVLSDPRKKKRSEIIYVRVRELDNNAETQKKALLIAVSKSGGYKNGKGVNHYLRLAHPETDMCCRWTGESPNPLE